MKIALVNGEEVRASADAPEKARCPADCECGGGQPVELCFLTRDGAKHWYYRHRPNYAEDLTPQPALVAGSPYLVMLGESVEQGIAAARQGDLKAILSLAFSPLVHLMLGRAGLAPEELLNTVLPEPNGGEATVLVTHDAEVVQELVTDKNGPPVFDLHPERNGASEDLESLIASAWYVPLFEPWGTQGRRIRRILERAERVYVLGEPSEWERILSN